MTPPIEKKKGWKLDKGLPIIFFFLLITALGGYVWNGSARITKAETHIDQNASCIVKTQEEQQQCRKDVGIIKERLVEIETHIGYMRDGFEKMINRFDRIIEK